MPLVNSDSFERMRALAAYDICGSARILPVKNAVGLLTKEIGRLIGIDERERLPCATWLCDNGRFLQEEAASLAIQAKETKRLPRVKDGQPRIALMCREYVLITRADFSLPTFTNCVNIWQDVSPLTKREIDALPTALRAALMETVINRLIVTCEQQREYALGRACFEARGESLEKAQEIYQRGKDSSTFMERLCSLARESENEEAINWLTGLLAQKSITSERLAKAEHDRQTENTAWISGAITSLRSVSHTPWHRALEDMSLVNAALLTDPARVYRDMDEESRAYYRARIARFSAITGASEGDVTKLALALSKKQEAQSKRHVGYYLLGDGQKELINELAGGRLRAKLWLFSRKHALPIYRTLNWLIFLALLVLSHFIGISAWIALPFAIVFQRTYRLITRETVRRCCPPKMVPRMEIARLTRAQRTLVVCPTLLEDGEHALRMVKRLAILQQANPDPRLHFMLLGDYPDSVTGTQQIDEAIVTTAAQAVESLREDSQRPFFYMQRARALSKDDHMYISRERKRGGLETLMKLICGMDIEDSFDYASCDISSLAKRYRYVITLDSDTFLPPGAALRLIGAMEHPLNKRRTEDGTEQGVSILQPRMETAAHTVTTRIGRYLGGRGGTDQYHSLSSDVMQDVFSRGSFMGKGIIAPEAFLRGTEGKIVPGTVLSHDLIEGELAGCELISDVILYDGQPATLRGFMLRLHRWTRGDWQLLPYLFPLFSARFKAPRRAVDALGKHKLWDNLLRSLAPLCKFAILLYAVGTGKPLLLIAVILSDELFSLRCPAGVLSRLMSLPCEVMVTVDAIGRTLYRLFVSKRRLMEWTTAAQVAKQGDSRIPMSLYAGLAAGAMAAACALLPQGALMYLGAALAIMWAVFPLTMPFIEQPIKREQQFDDNTRGELIRLAKSTFSFFDKAVSEADCFLPPDNIQLDPDKGAARRTSPTNIGLYLLSLICAQKLGLITTDDMARRIESTVGTLERLPRIHGLFYNWYDTQSLQVLPRPFVSSVDCGNLAACLICAAQGLRVLLPELKNEYHTLSGRLDALAYGMELFRLYDPDAELFYIGLNADDGSYTKGHYDLLASESRLLSFVAIMMRQAPVRHWSRLGRAMTKTRRSKTLVSYSGTMFEYLMPQLLLPFIGDTLLTVACRRAIDEQRASRLDGVWGVSESGYYAFDPSLSYLYKAFGAPSLALAPEAGANVIAPYASMLTLPFQVKRAFRNLQNMRRLGWEGSMGLFEATDFDSSRTGGEPKIIRSHMAHHQGMILCSVCNALASDYLVKLFFSLPRAQAHTLLLEERFPKRARVIRHPLKRSEPVGAQAPYRFSRHADPLYFPVDAHVLGGGRTTLVIDAQGGGYIQHNGVMLSRFRESCAIPSGIRYYIRDSQTGLVNMLTDPLLDGQTRFESAQAVFVRQTDRHYWTLRIFVSPLDGAQITLLTVKNRLSSDSMFEICSFTELALAPQRDDNAHPSFQNLFISTARAGRLGASATHRPRDKGGAPVTVAHSMCFDTPPTKQVITTDRTQFIGRNHTVYQPEALTKPIGGLRDSLGSVIEPCISLRAQFVLPALSEASFVFVTGVPSQGDAPESLQGRYPTSQSAEKAYALALTKSLVSSRFLGLEAEQQRAISRVTGCLVYTGQPHQQELMSELPISELWSMGISGDLPILTLSVSKDSETHTARLLCKAHALYRECGLWIDLVFIMTDSAELLTQRLRAIAQAQCGCEMLGVSGGVHFIDAQAAGQKKLALLRSISRLNLVSGEPISKQISRLVLGVRHSGQNAPPAFCEDMPPEAGELLSDNGFGGFDEAGDYVIRLKPDEQTPAPWSNMLASPMLGSLCSEGGVVFSYYRNSHQGRLTRWPSDSVSPYSGEGFYLTDDDRGICWSPVRFPLGQGIGLTVTHGAGFTQYDSRPYGLSARLSVFTDEELPLCCRTMTIKNLSGEKRTLRYCHVVGFTLGVGSQTLLTRAVARGSMVLAHNPDMKGVGFLATIAGDIKQALSMSEGAFYGLFGRIPIALCPGNALLRSDGSMGILEFELELEPGESATISTAVGFSENPEAMYRSLGIAARDGASGRLRSTKLAWENRLGALSFRLPDRALEIMLNRYLPYQVYASRLFARAGFYQAGGAYGFRDQLQDMLALMWTDAGAVRAHILVCAEHQFLQGDVQHWWHPPRLGVRTLITDDRLFLPYLTAIYVMISGDESILDEQVRYLDAPPLIKGESESVQTPGLTETTETLTMHCLRAINSMTFGRRELLNMGGGDWNDGMNRVGGENGESVWLSMFYAEVIRLFAPMCDKETKDTLLIRRQSVMEAIEKCAWDGDRYLRAWYDNQAPLGSRSSPECQIDALPQSWAAISGLDPSRTRRALDSMWHMLYEPQLGILRLFTPPFDGISDPGYIAGYLPGVRENGGQYTHAAPWAITAYHRRGMDDRAWKLAIDLMPYSHADTREKALKYRVEPYVMAGDVYAARGQEGRGGWTWYTGSAAWMYFAIIKELFGFEKSGDTVSLKTVLPKGWDGISLTYRFGGATYHINAQPDCAAPTLDGQPIIGGAIRLTDDGRIHEATFPASLAGGEAK